MHLAAAEIARDSRVTVILETFSWAGYGEQNLPKSSSEKEL